MPDPSGHGGRGPSLRGSVRSKDGGGGGGQQRGRIRRPNLLSAMKMASFRFSQRHVTRGELDVPEEGGDLHEHFRTCASLTRIREEFRSAIAADAERSMGFGLNACARPEDATGRLLLHSIGLNSNLVTSGGGWTAAAQSRVNQFVLCELLPAYPAAIIEEDDKGFIPFIEPIVVWIEARRAVRQYQLDRDLTREKVALVAAKLQRRMSLSAAAMKRGYQSDSDSEDSLALGNRKGSLFRALGGSEVRRARMELAMIVNSASDAMFCIDEKGKILITNDAATQQFGWTKKEFRGSNISIISTDNDASHHGKYMERYLRTGEKRVMGKNRELVAKRKDGSTFTIELGLTEVSLGAGKFIFVGFVKETTAVKRHRSSLDCPVPKMDDSQHNERKGNHNSSSAHGIPPLVEWCISILSDFVDNCATIGQTGGEDDYDDDSSMDTSSTNVVKVSTSNRRASLTDLRSSNRGHSRRGSGSFLVEMKNTVVVEKVATIPHLLEELLLIEDPEVRSRVFDISIVRKVLFSKASLGDPRGKWLVDMLDKAITVKKQEQLDANLTGTDVGTAEGRALQMQLRLAQDQCRFLAEGAVFYLEKLSELSMQDDLYVFHHVQMQNEVTRNGTMADMITTGDIRHFRSQRNELFDAVGGLNGLVKRICVLEDDLVKRAAATPVIRRLLDSVMFSHFATLAALFDGINHVLLLVSFRVGTAPALFYLAHNDAFQPTKYLFASVTLMLSVSYFGTKSIHTGIAKHSVSTNLFWSDVWTFWNFLDTVPLAMALFVSLSVDAVLRRRVHRDDDGEIPFFLRTMVAITTSFLWLRVLSFVKVRNKQLATFILCSVEIMKDIKWFLLVLFAAMGSFAQMLQSMTLDPSESQSQHYTAPYLKAYTMMLGDLDADALTTHPLITTLFVLYTFGVTVVLLNILIAIVSDSYQNSFISSKMMLGKARVMFVSELLSLRTFHEMWMDGKAGSLRRNVNYVFGTIAVLHLYQITGTVILILGHDKCQADTSPRTVIIEAALVSLFCVFLFTMMKVTIAYVLNEFDDTDSPKQSRLEKKPTSRLKNAMNFIISLTFSAMSSSFDVLDEGDTKDSMVGKSSSAQEYRVDKAMQRSIDKSRKALKSDLKVLLEQIQLSLTEIEDKHKQDISNLEAHITNTIAAVISESHKAAIHAIQSGYSGEEEYEDTDDDKSASSLSLNAIARAASEGNLANTLRETAVPPDCSSRASPAHKRCSSLTSCGSN